MLNDVFMLFQYLKTVQIVQINTVFTKLSKERYYGKFTENAFYLHYLHWIDNLLPIGNTSSEVTLRRKHGTQFPCISRTVTHPESHKQQWL